MLPDKCSVAVNGRRCTDPPESVISVAAESGEYMLGLACGVHREGFAGRVQELQKDGKIPEGRILFSEIKAVGTDCIRGDADDLIQL